MGKRHSGMSRSKRIKTCDNNDMRPWSDLNPDVLLLVMMQLGVVDFLAFSGVCKSWRSVTRPNRNMFMASKPPMLMCISTRRKIDSECCLEDSQGRKFKAIIPHSAGRSFLGLTCGYLILFGRKTKDFWLVNPITRHELHFPNIPRIFHGRPQINTVLVFSPSISRYVFVMVDYTNKTHMWYSVAGNGEWNCVPSNFRILNLHVFKKKIYAMCCDIDSWKVRYLRELTLYPEPKSTLFETKNFLNNDACYAELVSSGENFYVLEVFRVGGLFTAHELDFGKMEWEQFEDTRYGHAFFLSDFKYGVAVKPELWADPRTEHGRFNRHGRFFTANQWYFPHECLNVNSLDES